MWKVRCVTHAILFLNDCFVHHSAYGSQVGAAGIKFIPTGGLYVTGGLTPKNIQFIAGQNSPFMTAYHDKGRVKPILDTVPIFAVMVEDLGVRGALKNAQIEYEKYTGGHVSDSAGGKGMSDLVLWLHFGAAAAIGFAACAAFNRRK